MRRKKVLLIGHEPELNEILIFFLKDQGYEPIIASGEEVVLFSEPVVGQIVNLDMPYGKAKEYICRATNKKQALPIIFLTNKTSKNIGNGPLRIISTITEVTELLKTIHNWEFEEVYCSEILDFIEHNHKLFMETK